ncbi:hypothetical protein AAEO57_19735 [Flavobacterium sp. DGU38]|uniref:Carboxypeptidase regulatory-like domain-containing protein n=1 Tax=Flavobacterium calami TaxID=3139144 RepID=A0ABU9IV87_9FLAO
MKILLKFISPILIAIILLSFTYGQNSVKIYGELKPKKSEINVSRLKILVKTNNLILVETITDTFGKFKLIFIPKTNNKIDFYCAGIGNDTIFLKRMVNIQTDSLNLAFSLPVKYKLNLKGKVICPICKKTDKVFKIIYLNTNPYIAVGVKKTDDGQYDMSNVKLKQEKYTPIELSRYSCKRDSIKF